MRKPCVELGVCQFPRVRNVMRLERTDLGAFQRQQSNGVPIVTDKLDLECRAIAMHQHCRAHVTAHQSGFRKVTRQGHSVQFIDGFHNLGNG